MSGISGRNVPERGGGGWKNRQFSSILRGVFDLGAFSFGSVPPFVPSHNAVFDRESCAHLKGLLFLSWPPPERCSGPVSPSEYAYVRTCVCVCGFHVAASAMLTCLLSSASHPGHMSRASSQPASTHGANAFSLSWCLLGRDNAQLLHELHVFTAEEKSG